MIVGLGACMSLFSYVHEFIYKIYYQNIKFDATITTLHIIYDSRLLIPPMQDMSEDVSSVLIT